MITIRIAEELKMKCPNLSLGIISADVKLVKDHKGLWEHIDQVCEEFEHKYEVSDISKLPNVSAARAAYRACGKDPARYRLSSEALIRRVLKGKGLYKINNLVDVTNLISLTSQYSIGTYNYAKVDSEVVFRIGRSDEVYLGIGRGELNIENLPVLADAAGSFGSSTSDSERTMITNNTEKILMNIISFGGTEGLRQTVEEAKEMLVRYAEAQNIESTIIE